MPMCHHYEINGSDFKIVFDYHKHSSPAEPNKVFLAVLELYVDDEKTSLEDLIPGLAQAILHRAAQDMEQSPPPPHIVAALDAEMADYRSKNLLFKYVATDDPKVEEELRTMLGIPKVPPDQGFVYKHVPVPVVDKSKLH